MAAFNRAAGGDLVEGTVRACLPRREATSGFGLARGGVFGCLVEATQGLCFAEQRKTHRQEIGCIGKGKSR